jgi:hypothetical protein
MIAKVKSASFIDSMKIELNNCNGKAVKAVLRDEKGSVCSEMETNVNEPFSELTWKGLNDLPYGVYTLELTHGIEQLRFRIVKRI